MQRCLTFSNFMLRLTVSFSMFTNTTNRQQSCDVEHVGRHTLKSIPNVALVFLHIFCYIKIEKFRSGEKDSEFDFNPSFTT